MFAGAALNAVTSMPALSIRPMPELSLALQQRRTLCRDMLCRAVPCFAAGDLINAALKAAYGSSLMPCFKKTPELFEGHPLFTTLPAQGTVQKRVQLNLPLLLQELAPPAGAGAVRASVLLQCVSSRVWDSSSPQLDMARRTLAYFLVHKANPGLAEDPAAGDLPANPDGEAYTETYAHAGGATRSICLFDPGGKVMVGTPNSQIHHRE